MTKFRITLIYLFTSFFSLSIIVSLIFIGYKLINEIIINFMKFTYLEIGEKSMIVGCIFVVLFKVFMFLRGIGFIWKKGLQFDDFMKKAQQQKKAQENLLNKK